MHFLKFNKKNKYVTVYFFLYFGLFLCTAVFCLIVNLVFLLILIVCFCFCFVLLLFCLAVFHSSSCFLLLNDLRLRNSFAFRLAGRPVCLVAYKIFQICIRSESQNATQTDRTAHYRVMRVYRRHTTRAIDPHLHTAAK